MSPFSRFAWALVLSLLIWLPVAIGVLQGHIDLPRGGLYFLGALTFSWVGTGIINNLISSYRHTVRNVEHAKRKIEEIERRAAEAEQQPRRRSGD